MHDGFGIVIVTLAMKGSAEIVLVDEGDDDEGTLSWSFELQKGEMYVLSDNSRNKVGMDRCLFGSCNGSCNLWTMFLLVISSVCMELLPYKKGGRASI